MRRASLTVCLVLVGMAGCAGTSNVGFGPFPSSSFAGGQLTAGIANFVPGSVPREGEFPLLIANTDSTTGYFVVVTPFGGTATTRAINPCSVGTVAVPCDATTVQIDLIVEGAATPTTLTITPVAGACTQRIVYIAVSVQQSGGSSGGQQQTTPPTLTETLPASAANCGLSGLSADQLP